MRYVVFACSSALMLALYSTPPAAASGDDKVARLKARIEQLEAENKTLKGQVAKLTEQRANQKKPPAGAEVVIDIDGEDDITIEGKKHTLSSLRKLLADSPPRDVIVRKKGSTSERLQKDMGAFLKKNGYAKDSQLGTEQLWVPSARLSKKP